MINVLQKRKKQTQIMGLLVLVLFIFALSFKSPNAIGSITANAVLKSNSFNRVINSCQDSDHGINLYVSSLVQYGDKYYYDSCLDNNLRSYSGQYVVENYCYDDRHFTVIKYCANSCENGRCR